MLALAFRSESLGFSASVYRGRWGSVTHAISATPPLEQRLRFAWSKERFLFGNPSAIQLPKAVDGDSAARAGVNVHTVDDAVKSDLFWRYARRVDLFDEVLENVCEMAEGCPCHTPEAVILGGARHGMRQQRETQKTPCCLSSCRAPEFAAGAVDRLLSKMLRVANGAVLMDPAVTGDPASERRAVAGPDRLQLAPSTLILSVPAEACPLAAASARHAWRCPSRSWCR